MEVVRAAPSGRELVDRSRRARRLAEAEWTSRPPPTRSRRATPTRPTRCSTRRDLDMSGRFANVPPRSSPPKAPAEAMGPQDFRVLGPFSWSDAQEGRDVGARDEALPRERDAARRTRGARVGDRDARPDGRPEVLRPVRPLAAHDAAGRRRSTSPPSTRASASTAPRSAAGRGSASRTCCSMPDATSAILDPFTEAPTLSLICEIRDPLTRRGVRQGPAARREARRGVPALDRDRRHRVLRAPSASSSSSTRSRTSSGRTRRTTASTPPRATGTPASPGSATRSARRRATSRPRRTTRCTTCARRWC